MLRFGFGTFAFFLPERISFTTSVLAVFSRYVIEEALISMYFIAPWTKKIRKIDQMHSTRGLILQKRYVIRGVAWDLGHQPLLDLQEAEEVSFREFFGIK
jgi:hypothetical protein